MRLQRKDAVSKARKEYEREKGNSGRRDWIEKVRLADASTSFGILSSLREIFFDNMLKQTFEGEGVSLSDSTGFKIRFKLDVSLIDYYETLESTHLH